MNIETRKITFIQEFLKLQDEEIIGGLEKLLHEKQIELLENDLQPMSLEQFHADIDQSIIDIENGKVTEANDLKNKVKSW